ncbi:glutathione S-transferase [Candidatus Atelocyanobacterium thalassae]|nr:glutathione S-transferase [Candidatus Atelocyanobacterium thalassa]
MKNIPFYTIVTINLILKNMEIQVGLALPPPQDIPEEILRHEVITEGRSELTGEVLNSLEYAEMQEKLSRSSYHPEVNTKLKHLVFLLKIRKMLKTIIPIL